MGQNTSRCPLGMQGEGHSHVWLNPVQMHWNPSYRKPDKTNRGSFYTVVF